MGAIVIIHIMIVIINIFYVLLYGLNSISILNFFILLIVSPHVKTNLS